MNKGGESFVEPIPTRHGSLERIEPCEKAFNFPTAAIAQQRTTVLRYFTLPVAPVWCNHLNPLGSKGAVERITVIGPIPNNSSGLSHGDNFIEGSLDKGDFMRAGRIRVHGERKARSVCNNHELRTFTPLGLSHVCAPFCHYECAVDEAFREIYGCELQGLGPELQGFFEIRPISPTC